MKSPIFEIQPYFTESGLWVFDDPEKGLYAEALVAGLPEIIEVVCTRKHIPEYRKGFTVQFSEEEFAGYDAVFDFCNAGLPLTFKEIDMIASAALGEATVAGGGFEAGNTYRLRGTNMTGWLCPAMFNYFDYAPKAIFGCVIKGDMERLKRNQAIAKQHRMNV